MRLLVLSIGESPPRWAEEAAQSYAARIVDGYSMTLRQLPAARRGATMDAAQVRRKEAEALRAATPADALRVALDERGRPWSSADLAGLLAGWSADGKRPAFWIGGADGLDPPLLDEADLRWSLSALTLPHALARVLVAEQLYRAWSILRGHPYHR